MTLLSCSQPSETVRIENDQSLPLGEAFGGLGWKHEVSDSYDIAQTRKRTCRPFFALLEVLKVAVPDLLRKRLPQSFGFGGKSQQRLKNPIDYPNRYSSRVL